MLSSQSLEDFAKRLSCGPQVAGPGDPLRALAFLHRKKDRGVTLAGPQPSLHLLDMKTLLPPLHQSEPSFFCCVFFCFFPFSPSERRRPCLRSLWFRHKNPRHCFGAPAHLKGARWGFSGEKRKDTASVFSPPLPSSSPSPSSCTWS